MNGDKPIEVADTKPTARELDAFFRSVKQAEDLAGATTSELLSLVRQAVRLLEERDAHVALSQIDSDVEEATLLVRGRRRRGGG